MDLNQLKLDEIVDVQKELGSLKFKESQLLMSLELVPGSLIRTYATPDNFEGISYLLEVQREPNNFFSIDVLGKTKEGLVCGRKLDKSGVWQEVSVLPKEIIERYHPLSF